MQITLFRANVMGDAKNCTYPTKVVVTDADELKTAVAYDHVCAEYKSNYRNADNFLKSDCVVMDCDNDHSDNPADWITIESLDDLMSDISYAIATSRHHLLPKDSKTARPKFHVYFPIVEETSADRYTAIKHGIYKAYPFFDGNALDAARFLFGADSTEEALLESGVAERDVSSGGKQLEKAVESEQLSRYFAFLSAKQYLSFVMKHRDYKYITSALNAAKPMLSADVNDLDNNENLLNTPKATYDLSKGVKGEQEHNSGDLITKITECSPSDEGKQIWLDTLQHFFCGDKDLLNYVQQIVGLSAIGKVYVEALIIAYGEGSNGKSTFWNTIARVLGTYSGTISADALTVGCKRNVKPEVAELKGKRLVIAAELEEGMRLNTSMVKQLCSTDEVSAEKKYKDPFKYVTTHTLVLYTNHLPRVGANDDGTWRRLIVIPFNAKIEGKSDIKNYADYLSEKAGGAVLSWIIEGASKAINNNFKLKIPKVVEDAINRYRNNNDWLSIFIEDCCEVDTSYQQKVGRVLSGVPRVLC